MQFPALDAPAEQTLWARWTRLAERQPDAEAIAFFRAGEPTQRWLRGALIARARAFARWLTDSGVQAGDTCAIISRHHFDFYPLYMAVSGVGALPAVLPYPNARLHPDKFRAGLEGMARYSGLNWILTETDLRDAVEPVVSAHGSGIRGLLLPFDVQLVDLAFVPPEVSADAPALLQHSSGTTGLQKAVVLSHRSVLGHVAMYGKAIALRPDDRIVSWLPLYHDMGLIAALHLPLALGIPSVQMDPFEWVLAPALFPEVLSQERGTLSWMPNFAYALMGARLRNADLAAVSLDHVRMLVNCSEPIRAEAHEAFFRRMETTGLRSTALGGCYAMAEATFAVTQTTPGEVCREVSMSRDALSTGKAVAAGPGEPARVCVSSGRAIEGCEVMAVGPDGSERPDGEVGEIVVRSPTLFDGYRNRPRETDEVLKGGQYRTGDFGFRLHGEWFVVGRKKDLIIVAGKNLYPEDIEQEATAVEGAIAGRAVAFGIEDSQAGTEKVAVVMETELQGRERDGLRTRVIAAVQAIDVTLSEVYFVLPRWLIKSSSGKPSRSANRERILAERNQRSVR